MEDKSKDSLCSKVSQTKKPFISQEVCKDKYHKHCLPKSLFMRENKGNMEETIPEKRFKSEPAKNIGASIQELNAKSFCICKSEDDGTRPMIQCDSCQDWFHFDCVNLTEGNIPELYQCPLCEKKRFNRTKKIDYSPLDLLILAANNSSAKPIEEGYKTTLKECKDNSSWDCDTDEKLSEKMSMKKSRKLIYILGDIRKSK